MLAFVFTDFVYNSFCCLSASVFSCAFGSVFTYFFVFLSSCLLCLKSLLFSLLYCALMSLFCIPLFLLSVILFAVSFRDTVSAYLPNCV